MGVRLCLCGVRGGFVGCLSRVGRFCFVGNIRRVFRARGDSLL